MDRILKSGSAWFTIAATLSVVIGFVLSIIFWDWLNQGPEETRQANHVVVRNVGLLLGGVVAFIFALWRGWVLERQSNAARTQAETAVADSRTAQQGLRREIYQRGVEMLASSVLSVRLGGIYSLQHLAADHPDEYHIQVTELFCAFARNPTDKPETEDWAYAKLEYLPRAAPRLREDLQAVMNGIANRGATGKVIEDALRFKLDLRSADLRGASLSRADLAGADLRDAILILADLNDSDLSEANLNGAILCRAKCIGANLRGARMLSTDFTWAVLQNTDFSNSQLSSAIFLHASMRNSDLSGARVGASDLSHADLKNVNLTGAAFGSATRVTISHQDPERHTSEQIFARLTQTQLDQAVAEPDKPPTIAEGTVDVQTGEPLVWNGKAPCASHAPV